MNHGDELPKVIDKSQADINAAINGIKACDLPTYFWLWQKKQEQIGK